MDFWLRVEEIESYQKPKGTLRALPKTIKNSDPRGLNSSEKRVGLYKKGLDSMLKYEKELKNLMFWSREMR
jgi:hypothetical protein